MKIKLAMDGGYTFLETVIVLVIMAILTAGISLPALKWIEKAKVIAARTSLETMKMALHEYYLDCGRVPNTEQGLLALREKPVIHPVPENWKGPYIAKPTGRDPWGYEWVYRTNPASNSAGGDSYILLCTGSDGKEGGEGDAQDIE